MMFLLAQDTADYRSMIRQHFDLETVRMKLEEGLYSEGRIEFFRDLMLLFNNAVVFFPKNSPEHEAATALRAVVSKEMAKTIPKPHRPSAPLPAKEPTTPPRPLMKPKSEPAISLNGKPGSTGPIIACRKRSSISTKANPAVAAEMKKKEAAAEVERKPEAAAAGKEADDASVSVAAEPRVTKKRTMERTGGGARGTRTSKTRSNNGNNVGGGGRGSSGNPSPSSGGGAAAKAESSEAKAEKKNATNSGVAKKRSAANFLSRVKRSLSSNGTLLDSLKGSSVSGNGSGSGSGNGRGSTTEQKKGGGGGKSEGRRDQGQRQGSNGRQQAAAEQSSGKRSVGRPPKRAAATPPSKRGKETAEAEAKAPARKRARR
ncbi:hypothetical protein ACLOJK_021216 [Asimina triloba]